jgi:class 3 adenylate cyclase
MVNESVPHADPHSGIERRVATIMHADVAGYSRLMGNNEEGTVRVFRGHREVFESLVKMHRGRIFNTAGDALLAEFPSSVEAVRCATEIQAALHTRNEHLPSKERLQFRIGINLGDVIVQGGDLLGDGVNIAARVQTAAEPGGISVAGSVYDQIQNKLSLNFQPMGEKTYKNIAQSIRTYSIVSAESARPASRGSRRVAGMGIAAMLALVVAGVGYWGYHEYSARQAAEATRQSAEAAKRDAASRAQQQAAEAAARRATEAKQELERLARRQAADETVRKARDEAKRESALLAQRQAAEEAARKAADERMRLGEERRLMAAEKRAAEAQRNISPAPRAATESIPVSRPPLVAGVGRFDGTYGGRICNRPRGDPPKDDCWRVALQVQNGTLTGTWKSGVSGEAAWVKGRIGTDGAVTAILDSWSRRTKLPLGGSLAGQWADSEIKLSGTWADGGIVSASWKRAP